MTSSIKAPAHHQLVTPEAIEQAAAGRLYDVVKRTSLELNERLSARYGARVYLKREDQQPVRSYKIRGAYHLMSSLTAEERARGAVTASTGNHAQGVALAAAKLQIRTSIFVPSGTPPQKVNRIRHFGGDWAQVRLEGASFDDALAAALAAAKTQGSVFVHPFDDPRVIAGQGTIGLEIARQLDAPADFVVMPVGGGGLSSGIGTYLRAQWPDVTFVGVESAGAAAMYQSLAAGHRIELAHMDKFVDASAVKSVGALTFEHAKSLLSEVIPVPEGKTCTAMVELYQNEGIITEPAGALAVSALDQLAATSDLAGKTIVALVSGGNNDLLRYPEILERSLAYEGLKHYLLVEFDQKPGQLRQFVDQALAETDDITRFEYIKKTNRDRGAALVGIEVAQREDFPALKLRLAELGVAYRELSPAESLYGLLI